MGLTMTAGRVTPRRKPKHKHHSYDTLKSCSEGINSECPGLHAKDWDRGLYKFAVSLQRTCNCMATCVQSKLCIISCVYNLCPRKGSAASLTYFCVHALHAVLGPAGNLNINRQTGWRTQEPRCIAQINLTCSSYAWSNPYAYLYLFAVGSCRGRCQARPLPIRMPTITVQVCFVLL